MNKNELKIASMFLVFIILVLAVTVTSNAQTDTVKPDITQYVDNYVSTHKSIIAYLEQEKRNSPEIKRLVIEAKKLQEAIKKTNYESTKYSDRYSELTISIWRKCPFTKWSTFQNLGVGQWNPLNVEKLLADSLSIYKNTLDCFNQGRYSRTRQCEDFRKVCKLYGAEGTTLFHNIISDDLTIQREEVSEVDKDCERASDKQNCEAMMLVSKDLENFCRLISLTTGPFSPSQLMSRRTFSFLENIFVEGFVKWIEAPSESSFKEWCIDKKPSNEKVRRLFDLKAKYPDDEYVLKRYYESYEEWSSQCQLATQYLCQNSYVIKGQLILAYPTVGCKIRDVTKEDIEQDIKLITMHSQKLKHSTLLDTINICQTAYNNGFSWQYQKPSLSENCTKDDKKTTEKQSK